VRHELDQLGAGQARTFAAPDHQERSLMRPHTLRRVQSTERASENPAMATAHDPAPTDLRIATITAPGSELEARFAAGAGMVGCSLRHRGDELLGLLGGLDAYVERGKTFGIPFLYPWANRLGAWGYEVAGRTVTLDPDAGVVRSDPHGLPI